MFNWKDKLTSRKLWTAIVSFISLLIVAMGGTDNQAAQVSAIVMAGASVIAYIIGEGLIDAADTKNNQVTAEEKTVEEDDTDEEPQG